MARVVAEVLLFPGRLTLRWSEGDRTFESYDITGGELAALLDLAERSRQQLGLLADGTDSKAALKLAQVGQQMHGLLFPGSGPFASLAAEIRQWLEHQQFADVGDGLEIAGSGAAVIPWTLIYDSEPDAADFQKPGGPGWKSFWGVRYSLSAGYRYNPLRGWRVLEEPAILLAIDPKWRSALVSEQRQALQRFLDSRRLNVVESVTELAVRLRESTPDFLCLQGPCVEGALELNGQRLTVQGLRELLLASERGQVPWNNLLLFVNPSNGESSWPDLRERLFRLQISGLIVPEKPLPPDSACEAGLQFLEAVLGNGDPVCEALQNVRAAASPLALGYTTTCPLHLQIRWLGQVGGTASSKPSLLEEKEENLLPLPEEPYRPLRPCDRADRPLLVGREDDLAQVAQMVDAPGSRIVLVHGRGGVGKRSLLRAGVIPALEDNGIGYRALTDRSEGEVGAESDCPVLAIRTTTDLAGQLALALCEFTARPYVHTTPTGREVTIDLADILAGAVRAGAAPNSQIIRAAEPSLLPGPGGTPPTTPGEGNNGPLTAAALRQALLDNSGLLTRILDALGAALPFELVLLIENGEELYTLTQTIQELTLRRQCLEILRELAQAPGHGRLLLSIRTEYHSRLSYKLGTEGVRSYYVQALDRQNLIDVIQLPTSTIPLPGCSEVPAEAYGFSYAPKLAEQIASEALIASNEAGEEALPLVHMICARLVERAQTQGRGVITQVDLKPIGGVKGGMVRYIEAQLGRLRIRGGDRDKLKILLTDLVRRQPEGTLTRGLVRDTELARGWRRRTPFGQVLDTLASEEMHLIEPCWVDVANPEERRFSLTSDALLPVLAQHREQDKINAAWKWVGDLLWIGIPLLILMAVYTWTWVRAYYRDVQTDEEKKALKQVIEEGQKLRVVQEAEAFPQYVAQVREAAEAWRTGHILRAQQLLHFQRAQSEDQRGFEWYYLWQQVRGSGPALRGHLGPISAIAASADGKLAATASLDGRVKLWRLPAGRELTTLTPGKGPVHAVALSDDGTVLAAAGADRTLRIWTLKSKGDLELEVKLAHSLTGHKDTVLTLALSADAKLAITGSRDGVVKLWDVSAGKETASAQDHSGPVHMVVLSPDGKTMASGGGDRVLIIRDAAGKKLHTLKDQPGPVRALAFLAEGKVLASGHVVEQAGVEVGQVRFLETASGKEKGQAIDLPFAVLTLNQADSGALVVGGKGNKVLLLANGAAAAPQEQPGELKGHLGWVSAIARSGGRLLTGSYDGTVQLWDNAPTVLQASKDWLCSLALSPDDKMIAAGTRDGTIKVFEAATGKLLRTLAGPATPILSLSFTYRGKDMVLAAGDSDGKSAASVYLWKMDSDKPWKVLKDLHPQAIRAVAFSPDGKLLATASSDGLVRLLDPEKESVLHKFEGHKGTVLTLAFAPGGKLLASAGEDGSVRLWSPGDGKQVAQLEKTIDKKLAGHTAPVQALAFSPDGKGLVSASADQTIKRWDVEGKVLVSTLRGHNGPVLAVAFSPRGEAIVSAGRDGTVKLWDLRQAAERFTFADHKGPVRGVGFSSNRRLLVTAGHDGTVRLYHAGPEDLPRQVADNRE